MSEAVALKGIILTLSIGLDGIPESVRAATCYIAPTERYLWKFTTKEGLTLHLETLSNALLDHLYDEIMGGPDDVSIHRPPLPDVRRQVQRDIPPQP